MRSRLHHSLVALSCTVLGLSACQAWRDIVPPPEGWAEASVEVVREPVCADPDRRMQEGPFERRTREEPSLSDVWTWAGGITTVDLDQDGFLDILAPVERGLDYAPGGPTGPTGSIGTEVFGDFDLSFA